MTDQLLDHCVERFTTACGPFEQKMGAVLTYLADELMKDAFPYDYCGSSEIFIDANKLRQRLLKVVDNHPGGYCPPYQVHLSRITAYDTAEKSIS
jgi:hypothetical protein